MVVRSERDDWGRTRRSQTVQVGEAVLIPRPWVRLGAVDRVVVWLPLADARAVIAGCNPPGWQRVVSG